MHAKRNIKSQLTFVTAHARIADITGRTRAHRLVILHAAIRVARARVRHRARVQALAVKHGMERSQRYLGRTIEVLVEDKNPRKPGQVMGRTRQGRQVFFDGDIKDIKGEFVEVEITEARTWSLMGKPIQ